MQIKKFVNDVSNQIKYKPIRMEISKELETHIQEIKRDYMNNGMENSEAEARAVSQMGNAKTIGKSLNRIHKPKLDWKLLMLLLFLIGYGIINSIFKQAITDGYNYIAKAISYMVLSAGLGICLYFIDYRKIKKYSDLLYAIATFVMLVPMITYNGDFSFNIFKIKFIPYILSIPLYIIAFVGYIDKNKFFESGFIIKTVILTIASLLIVSFISFINTIILATIYLIILIPRMNNERAIKFFISGIIIYLFLTTICITFLNGELKFDTGLLFEKKSNYDEIFIGETKNKILTHSNLIGEANTEEISNSESIIYKQSQYTLLLLLGKLGIIPVLILIMIMTLVSIRIVYHAKNINDNYGKLLIIGLGMLYIIQAIINIFMNFSTRVNADINLPLITYGATYTIVNVCSMSIILSVYRRKDIIFYNVKKKGFISKLGQLLIYVDKKIA